MTLFVKTSAKAKHVGNFVSKAPESCDAMSFNWFKLRCCRGLSKVWPSPKISLIGHVHRDFSTKLPQKYLLEPLGQENPGRQWQVHRTAWLALCFYCEHEVPWPFCSAQSEHIWNTLNIFDMDSKDEKGMTIRAADRSILFSKTWWSPWSKGMPLRCLAEIISIAPWAAYLRGAWNGKGSHHGRSLVDAVNPYEHLWKPMKAMHVSMSYLGVEEKAFHPELPVSAFSK